MDEATTLAGTYVQLGRPEGRLSSYGRGRQMPGGTAAVLKAVLLAAAEQVSSEKLTRFKVQTALDLDLFSLAMAFRADDTGLVGDVFEWSVLLAINTGESEVTQMVSDALRMSGLTVDKPQAVLVAAEGNRLVDYSPDLPPTATLATGKRGQPPKVAKLLLGATTKNWKADLLLGEGERWVSASLKSNPAALPSSFADAEGTIGAPRIGVTATGRPGAGIVRDPASGGIIVKVPVDGRYFTLARLILNEVRDAFIRHLSVPSTPLQQDISGVAKQLWYWRDRTVAEVIAILDEISEQTRIPVSPAEATGASVDDATASLVAVNTLAPEGSRLPIFGGGFEGTARKGLDFELLR